MNNIKEMLDKLATDEEREALRKARLSGIRYDLSKIIFREKFTHGVNAKATATRRAKNQVARRQRKVNARHG